MADSITLYERMTKVETKLDNLTQWQDEIKDSIKEIKTSIVSMSAQNDDKYAGKRTETIVDSTIWIVVTFVILWVLALLVKKK